MSIDIQSLEETVNQLRERIQSLITERDTARESRRSLQTKVDGLQEIMVGWVDNSTDTEDIINELCQLFDISDEVEVEFEATVRVSGHVTRKLTDTRFDLDDAVGSFSIEGGSTDVYVSDYDIQSVDEA